MPHDQILDKLYNAVIEGDETLARKATDEAISSGIDPVTIVQKGLSKGMDVIGERFRKMEIFLPQVILAADAMKAGMAVLKPLLTSDMGNIIKGNVVAGTVFGDIHDIGKNFVVAMLEAAGYEVNDLGCDVPPKKYVEKAVEANSNLIALSCLLSPSMYYQKDVIKLLKDMNLREKYYVMVGGGPITPSWAEEIEADGYGRLADHAVMICNELMENGAEASKPVIRE
jgi:corrinoid protein of di/trimethylamine methyltransferase